MSSTDPQKQFWTLRGEEAREAAFAFASSLECSSPEQERRASFLQFATNYAMKPVASLYDFTATSIAIAPLPAGLSRNTATLTRTLVDTAMSRFARTETRVQLLTSGADPATRRQAEDLTDAANALVVQTDAEVELRKAALAACLFDLGVCKVIDSPDGPRTEYVPPWELMTDAADAHRGRPTIFVQRTACDRDALEAEFADGDAELAEAIRESGGGDHLVTPDHSISDQHCLVYELWRLPVGKRPGRHIVCTDHALLLEEDCAGHPFVFVTWDQAPIGFYPQSLAAIVANLDAELEGVRRRRSQILRLCAVPRYIVRPAGESTEYPPLKIADVRGGSDAIGDILELAPGASLEEVRTVEVHNILSGLAQYENDTWGRGYTLTGISEASATGQRPAGVSSGIALTTYNDIQQDRLSLVALRYQKAHVDLADKLLKSVAHTPEFEISIKSKNGEFLRRVRVEELQLADADYVVQSTPVSAMPSTPTGRLQMAAELLDKQAIDRDQFTAIAQLPDVKAELNVNLAGRRAAEKIVSKMIETGVFISPPDTLCFDPTTAAQAIKNATARHLEGIADDLPDDRLQLLENWIDCIRSRVEAKTPAAPVMPAPAPQMLPQPEIPPIATPGPMPAPEMT